MLNYIFFVGHKSYLGFIYMNYCYNNAVMHVFSHLLEKSVVRQNSLEQEANVERVELVGADVIAKSQNRGDYVIFYAEEDSSTQHQFSWCTK